MSEMLSLFNVDDFFLNIWLLRDALHPPSDWNQTPWNWNVFFEGQARLL